jgi:hypothetical protein
MKKLKYNPVHSILLAFLAVTLIVMSSCKKESLAAPVITEVRNYAASPYDTIVHTINPGQWIVLKGKNLSGASAVTFGGIVATINSALFSDESLVVQLPDIPFESIAKDKLNKVTVISEGGTTTYDINVVGAPIIARVRNYSDSPNDTILKAILPGQKVNVIGYNLNNPIKISFQGVVADLSTVVYTDSSAIVQVPTNLSGGDASLTNMISYTSMIGTGTFAIKIFGPPSILSISYEIPKAGDSVYINGSNLSAVQSLSFAGTTISSFKESADGNSVGFVAPALTQSGPIVISTLGGTFTTAYNVNEVSLINSGGVGILGNMEWGDYFGWPWWGGNVTLTSSDPNSGWPSYNADFGVGLGMYAQYKSNILNGGAGDDGNALLMNNGKSGWVPAANLTDLGTSWALKFEINVKKPWKGGTLCIKTWNANFIARYEPWQISSTKSISYTTKGWQTVTIPLSEFRAKDVNLIEGKGSSITKVSDLLDPATQNSNLKIYIHNYGTAATQTSFDAAFDNFRVVKR